MMNPLVKAELENNGEQYLLILIDKLRDNKALRQYLKKVLASD